MEKRILFLGGANSQIPAISYAKSKGYYVITADYLPNNPGHQISDEYHNISTVDKKGILDLSKKLNIRAISSYASDPGAITAAYVSDKMGLIGTGTKATTILSNKLLFREFQSLHGFNHPWFISGESLNELLNIYDETPAIIKPVDSSGSKGISKISSKQELHNTYDCAIAYSRRGKVIIEKYIKRKGPQIHGEGFIYEGRVVFLCLGDQMFSGDNGLIPYSTTIPSLYHSDFIIQKAKDLVNHFIKKTGFKTGGINVEIIRDNNDELYLLEIGARNGGNYMPQLVHRAVGVDLVQLHIESMFQILNITDLNLNEDKNLYAQVILHSKRDGIFEDIFIPTCLQDCILDKYMFLERGDAVRRYKSSKDVVGVLILKLKTKKDIDEFNLALDQNSWILLK